MRHILLLMLLVLIHQAQSTCTQEDIEGLMPYILNQVESKFVSNLQFIAVRKTLIKHDNTIKTWTPLLTYHDEQISTINEKIVNIQKTPGPTGAPGQKGDPGVLGNPGQPGSTGLPGTRGGVGNPGAVGPRGLPGEKGDHGANGSQGPRGTQGPSGKVGTPGPSGPIGLNGQSGPPGPPGPVGPVGPIGPIGPPGIQREQNAEVMENQNNINLLTSMIQKIKKGVNECHTSPSPCQHGSTCVDKPTGFICECATGYSGEKCEINKDDCMDVQCGDHGTCIDGLDTYSCQCDPGYTGALCDKYYTAVEDWCTGEQYQVILGKCFYFEKTKMRFSSAKQNCLSMTKQGRSGKLAEPTTLQITAKLLQAAENTFGKQGVHIGVEKIDNNGNMKYTSTGIKTPISPWNVSGSGVKAGGMKEPYICMWLSNSSVAGKWQDCPDSSSSSYSLDSVCEF